MRDLRPFFFTALFASCLGCSAVPAATSSSAASSTASSSSAASEVASAKLPKPDATGELILAVGGKALVAPDTVLILERVVSDSRCPVDVTCVWAGEIQLAFTLDWLESEAPTKSFELSTRAPSTEIHGLLFELKGAGPPPRSTVKLAPSDYRVSLRVSPVPSRKEP